MYTYVVIDDESLIRKGVVKKLSGMEDRISCIGEAGNAEEGLSLITEKKPDFAIIDMQMPGMGGMGLLPLLEEKCPSMPKIVISGYRDFDYIKQAISSNAVDYLLKPFSREALVKCVEAALDRLESREAINSQLTDSSEKKEEACYEYDLQYLTNLILGYHTGNTTITSQKLNFINNTHQLVLFTLKYFRDDSAPDIQTWMEDGGFGDLALYLSSDTVPRIGFLVLFIPKNNPLGTRALTGQISDQLLFYARHQNIPLLIGISQPHQTLNQLHNAFEETASALNQQLLNGDLMKSYYYEKDLSPQILSWDREDEFLFRVEAGMIMEVNNLSECLFDWVCRQKGATLYDAKYYCYHLSDQCRHILDRYMKQGSSSGTGGMQNVVSHIFQIDDLKNYYRQFFVNIADMLKSESDYAVEDVVEKIRIYLEHNYQKDLTQDFVASLFYLNRCYLSTLFRQKTGMKFIDFLNQVRIEKAKELLQNSDRKTYQVAKAVGYDNVKYFFRIFKKNTGMTPEQYRDYACSNR